MKLVTLAPKVSVRIVPSRSMSKAVSLSALSVQDNVTLFSVTAALSAERSVGAAGGLAGSTGATALAALAMTPWLVTPTSEAA